MEIINGDVLPDLKEILNGLGNRSMRLISVLAARRDDDVLRPAPCQRSIRGFAAGFLVEPHLKPLPELVLHQLAVFDLAQNHVMKLPMLVLHFEWATLAAKCFRKFIIELGFISAF